MRITDVVQRSDTRAGRAFDLVVIGLILVSVVTLSVETLPDLDADTRRALDLSEVVITVLFTIEYALRVATAERRLAYVFSFYGLIDLLAIAPFYLALGLDLRGVRAFRLFRLFRLLKLARYSRALGRFQRALRLAREEAALFFLVTVVLLYLAAVGIYYFEHPAQPEQFVSIPHSLWWAVATLTTVGYGDVYPITAGGKFFTFVVLMLGLGVVAVPAGLVATALTEARRDERDEARERERPVLRIFEARAREGAVERLARELADNTAGVVSEEPGNLGYYFGEAASGDGRDLVFVSIWADIGAVRTRFGEDWERPHLPPEQRDLVERCSVRHVEVRTGVGAGLGG